MSSAVNPRRSARKRIPPATRRRALELLASCRDGCTEAIMLAHGFTIERMVKLVRVGLARATAERVVGGNRTIEIAQVWIIEAGRRALAPS
jgi:hypothetical protein